MVEALRAAQQGKAVDVIRIVLRTMSQTNCIRAVVVWKKNRLEHDTVSTLAKGWQHKLQLTEDAAKLELFAHEKAANERLRAGELTTGITVMQGVMVTWMRSSVHVLVGNWRLKMKIQLTAAANMSRIQVIAIVKMRRAVMQMKGNILGVAVSDWRLEMHADKSAVAKQSDLHARRRIYEANSEKEALLLR